MPRSFPDSAAAWAIAFPTIAVPAAIWTFQETASPIDDKVGAVDLVENAGAALLYNQSGDPLGRGSLKMNATGTTTWTGASASTFGDIVDGVSWSLWIRFRMPDTVGTNRLLVCKGTANPRWILQCQATNGHLRWFIADGTTQFQPNIAVAHDEDPTVTYHDALLVYDAVADTFSVRTELGSASVSAAALLAAGIPALTGIRVGAPTGATQVGAAVSYMAHWPTTAITSAQFTALLTAATQEGTLDITSAAVFEAAGAVDLPGALDISGAAVFAAAGLSDTPGTLDIAGASAAAFDGVPDGSGTLDVAATGGVEFVGETASEGTLSVVAGCVAEFAGILGVTGELHITSTLDFGESADLGFFFLTSRGEVVFSEEDFRPIVGVGARSSIKSLKNAVLGVWRGLKGDYDEEGEYRPTTKGYFTMEANVQPASQIGGRRMRPNAEGKHGEEEIVIYTTVEIHTVLPTHDADIVVWKGEQYEVGRVEDWHAFGQVHYEAYASRLELP